ncbi:MAG: DUF885 domain-containing protein [Halieaceae bacterium]
MSYRGITSSLLLAVGLSACGAAGDKGQDPATSAVAADMLKQQATQVMRLRSLNATRLGLTDEDVGARVNDAMDAFGSAHMREWRRNIRSMRSDLDKLPAGSIDPLTRAAMDDIYAVYLGGSEIPFGYIDIQGRHRPYVINQIDQPLQEVPRIMVNFQRVATAEDAADYLRRMWAITSLVDSVLGKFNADADAGWIPPRPVLEGALVYLDNFTTPAPEEHELVTSLLAGVDEAGQISTEQREQIRQEAIALMMRVVYPAYLNAARTVRLRLPEARTEAGIWAQPLGAKFYAHSIRHEALSDKSAEEIHRLGLAEVKRILAEMDRGLKAQGLATASVGERMSKLASEQRFLFEDSATGRERLIVKLNATAGSMQARLPQYFGRLPEQGVVIRPVPAEREAGAAGGSYDGPPADGSGPGTFWINLRDMDDLPWFRLPTLTYHETVPGHHLQVALARSQRSRPMLWRFSSNSAYSEGWALYAELLAAEMGVYESDPYADLGRLQAELFRAVRLVVDTGMHEMRWTREQAIDYMQSTTGRGEVDVTAEIQRYMAWPGQALSYKLGMIEILDIRANARARLGEAFDLKVFHDKVLATGPVSMPLLREQLAGWTE